MWSDLPIYYTLFIVVSALFIISLWTIGLKWQPFALISVTLILLLILQIYMVLFVAAAYSTWLYLTCRKLDFSNKPHNEPLLAQAIDQPPSEYPLAWMQLTLGMLAGASSFLLIANFFSFFPHRSWIYTYLLLNATNSITFTLTISFLIADEVMLFIALRPKHTVLAQGLILGSTFGIVSYILQIWVWSR